MCRVSLCVLMAATGLAHSAAGQDVEAPNPEAQDVLAKYVEARGGARAIEDLDGVLRISEWSIGETSGTLRTAQESGGVFRSVLKVAGSTWQELRGANGTEAWVTQPNDACFLLSPADGLVERMMHDVRWPIDHGRYFDSMAVDGREQVVDRAAWKLTLRPVTGEPISAWFDIVSGLLRRMDVVQTATDGSSWVVETTFDSWKPIDGVQWPAETRRTSPAGTLEISTQTQSAEPSGSLRTLPDCVQQAIKDRPVVTPAQTGDHVRLREMIGPTLINKDGDEVPTDVLAHNRPVLLYFSALWCPPCKVFTPKLVETYDTYGEQAFDVILISSDRSAAKMVEYMKAAGMNWYAVPWAHVTASGIKQTWGSGRIPNLVWLNSHDETVTGAYTTTGRRGVDAVLADFRKHIGAD